MAEKSSFTKGKKEVSKKGTAQPKSTAKTREATKSKGGHRERELK